MKRYTGKNFKAAMLQRQYNLALFSDKGKLLRTVHVRGWAVLLCACLALGMTGLAAKRMVRFKSLSEDRARLNELTSQRLTQNELLLERTARIIDIENTLARIIDFDAKLRIMLNIARSSDLSNTLSARQQGHRGLSLHPSLYGRNLIRLVRGRAAELTEAMFEEEIQQQDIAHAISQQMEYLATIPVIMPTRGRFSSGYGTRVDPFTGKRRFHKGIDLTAPTGTPIRTTANGIVTQVSTSSSYGLVIVVTHSDRIKTRYAHLSRFGVEEGQRVIRGQVIGYVGNTGRSKAPHLHYEVHVNDQTVNPRNYILQ